jgi:hypothetical protein
VVTGWALIVPTILVVLVSGAGLAGFLALTVVAAPIYFLAANTIVGRCGSSASEAVSASVTPAPGVPAVSLLRLLASSSKRAEGGSGPALKPTPTRLPEREDREAWSPPLRRLG